MIPPIITVCGHRNMNILDLATLAKIFPENKDAEDIFLDQKQKDRLNKFAGLLHTLNTLSKNLHNISQNYTLNLAPWEHSLLQTWSKVRRTLLERTLITTLLTQEHIKGMVARKKYANW